jgi:hypothetical protein
VCCGGFRHVGFPLRTSVSPPTLYLSSLQLPLSPLSPLPSRRSRVPASAVVLCHPAQPRTLTSTLSCAAPPLHPTTPSHTRATSLCRWPLCHTSLLGHHLRPRSPPSNRPPLWDPAPPHSIPLWRDRDPWTTCSSHPPSSSTWCPQQVGRMLWVPVVCPSDYSTTFLHSTCFTRAQGSIQDMFGEMVVRGLWEG